MTTAAEQPIASIPRDGSYVNVRVGKRWFKGFFGLVTGEEETGERVYAFLGSDEPRPVIADAWLPRRSSVARCDSPAGSRPQRAADVQLRAALPDALITLADVMRRIDRAILTAKHMQDPEWRFLSAGKRVNWPAYIYDGEDRKAQKENQSNLDAAPQRFVPSNRDLSELDEAMEWFRAMNMPQPEIAAAVKARKLPLSLDQKLIWWRAIGASFATVARYMGASDETARRRTHNAYARLHSIADGHLRRRLQAARRAPVGSEA